MGRRIFHAGVWALAMSSGLLLPASMARGGDAISGTSAPGTSKANTSNAASSVAAAAAREPLAWPDLLNRIASAISSKDIRALNALLDPLPVIRAFGSDSAQPAERLLACTMNGKVLAAHGYIGTPSTLASDLAKDLKAIPDGSVAPEAIDALCPKNSAALKRANDTAARWIGQVLQPTPQQLVGVIAIWPGQSGQLTDAPASRPIFILVLGDLAPRSARCIIERISFGDPLDSVR